MSILSVSFRDWDDAFAGEVVGGFSQQTSHMSVRGLLRLGTEETASTHGVFGRFCGQQGSS